MANLGNVSFIRELAGLNDEELIREIRYKNETPMVNGQSTLKHKDPPIEIIETRVDLFLKSDEGKLRIRPIGHAILLSSNLLFTTHTVLSNAESPIIIKTYNNRLITLSPDKAFITSSDINYTIIASEPFTSQSLDMRVPFKLASGCVVRMLDQDP